MKTIKVVAAIICDNIKEKNKIFATARGYGELKGGWEFPGGKVESGETPQQALVREIMEELDTEIKVGELIDTIEFDYPSLCDTNHVLFSDYSEVIVVGAGADAVDYKLISICHRGDIVVSQDYGVAAMALGKNAYAIHQSGKWYTNENIDQMLMERHLNKKARRASGKNHLRDPRKRTSEDDEHFRESFEKMIHMAMDKEK